MFTWFTNILKNLKDRIQYRQSIKRHLNRFRKGAVKLQSRENFLSLMESLNQGIGHPRTGTFVIPADAFQEIVQRSGGNPRVMEDLLGLPEHYLGNDPVVIFVRHMRNLRLPLGTEAGAYKDLWVPGGYTKGGIPEAVIDQLWHGDFIAAQLVYVFV